MLAGSVLATIDMTLLASKHAGLGVMVVASSCTIASALLVGGVIYVGRLLTQTAIRLPVRALFGATLCSPMLAYVSWRLFQGTGIRHHPIAPYGPTLVGTTLSSFAFFGLWALEKASIWAQTRQRASIVGTVPLLVGTIALWIDRTFYPNQYAYLHNSLLLLAFLGFLTAVLFFSRWRHTGWRTLTLAVAMGAAAATIVSLLGGLSHSEDRQAIADHTHVSGRLIQFFRNAFDFDRDGHSIVFGGRDCDNLNSLIHPYAIETPNNGVDEDCDGMDSPVSEYATRGTDHKGLPRAKLRRMLSRWRGTSSAQWRTVARYTNYNVILLVVDALRADQLVDNAENNANHPTLTRMCRQGRNFLRTYSRGSGTDIGMATLLTGALSPFSVGQTELLLSFNRAGYRTMAVIQREVQRWLGKQIAIVGLDQKHVIINDPDEQDRSIGPTSEQVIDRGLAWLREFRSKDRSPRPPGSTDMQADSTPFFLWLHLFDVHEHHQIAGNTIRELDNIPRGLPRYRALLKHVDRHVRRLVNYLENTRNKATADRTLIVLTSDHGEGLALHDRLPFNHGARLYEPLVRVPLCFSIPGIAPRVVHQPVSVADIFPSLADLAGIQVNYEKIYGTSLVPWLLDLPHKNPIRRMRRAIPLVESEQIAVVDWPSKLISWRSRGRLELYDLEQDPEEAHNLVESKPFETARLMKLLTSFRLPQLDRNLK